MNNLHSSIKLNVKKSRLNSLYIKLYIKKTKTVSHGNRSQDNKTPHTLVVKDT